MPQGPEVDEQFVQYVLSMLDYRNTAIWIPLWREEEIRLILAQLLAEQPPAAQAETISAVSTLMAMPPETRSQLISLFRKAIFHYRLAKHNAEQMALGHNVLGHSTIEHDMEESAMFQLQIANLVPRLGGSLMVLIVSLAMGPAKEKEGEQQ